MIAKTAHSGKKRLCHVMSCQRTQRLHSSQPTEIYDRRTPANHPFLQGTGKKHPHATRKLSGGISKPLAGLTSLERFATDEQSFRSFAFEVEAELRPLATPPAGNQALTGPCSIVQHYYAAWEILSKRQSAIPRAKGCTDQGGPSITSRSISSGSWERAYHNPGQRSLR